MLIKTRNFLVALWVLTFYFLLFSWLLPVGVNKTFVTISGQFSFLLSTVLSLIFFLITKPRHSKKTFSRNNKKKESSLELFIILLPLTPVMQYILNNREILSLWEDVYIFFVFTILSFIIIIAIPTLLQTISSRKVLMSLGVAFVFSITNMGQLSRQFAWHEVGYLKIQLAVFAGVFLLFQIFFYSNSQKFLYVLNVIIFLNASITPFLSGETVADANLASTDNKLVTLVGKTHPRITPNIYLLIYDAYVVNETMLSYGIDNQAQEDLLRELGFKIYPHTYSVGNHTLSTMNRVLNVSTQYDKNDRSGVSSGGRVQSLLKEFSYKSYGVFYTDYFFRGAIPAYDYYFPSNSSPANTLIKAMLTGEFKFSLEFIETSRKQFLDRKNSAFSEEKIFPKFIYIHSGNPGHSQNSGACLPNERELFKERLMWANLEMSEDVEYITEHDENAIIIVAGDHGPYLTKNCAYTSDHYNLVNISRLDIQDRFGTFLAIKWSSPNFEAYDNIVILQDVFPSIFAYIFQNKVFLTAKIEPITLEPSAISGANVVDGVIEGGIHSGEPLFILGNEQ